MRLTRGEWRYTPICQIPASTSTPCVSACVSMYRARVCKWAAALASRRRRVMVCVCVCGDCVTRPASEHVGNDKNATCALVNDVRYMIYCCTLYISRTAVCTSLSLPLNQSVCIVKNRPNLGVEKFKSHYNGKTAILMFFRQQQIIDNFWNTAALFIMPRP